MLTAGQAKKVKRLMRRGFALGWFVTSTAIMDDIIDRFTEGPCWTWTTHDPPRKIKAKPKRKRKPKRKGKRCKR